MIRSRVEVRAARHILLSGSRQSSLQMLIEVRVLECSSMPDLFMAFSALVMALGSSNG